MPVVRDLRGERLARAGLREERLRATTGLRRPASMTSWRGASGQRYVVGVHPLGGTEIVDIAEAVVIAVERLGNGTARVIDVAAPDPAMTRRSHLRWLALMRTRGATEMHVHRLAESPAERRAVLRDLAGEA